MNIVIHIPVWKRPEILEICKAGLNRICEELPSHEIRCVFIDSPEDETRNRLDVSTAEWPFLHYEALNSPLSNKLNYGMYKIKGLNPDAVIFLGSDNILSTSYLKECIGLLKQGFDFIGSQDLHILDSRTKELIYFPGYSGQRAGLTLGAGRCFYKRLLDAVGWMPWPNGLEKYMDNGMSEKLAGIKYKKAIIQGRKRQTWVLDIKSDTNISPMPTAGRGYIARDWEKWKRNLSDKEIELIEKL